MSTQDTEPEREDNRNEKLDESPVPDPTENEPRGDDDPEADWLGAAWGAYGRPTL